MWKEKKNAWKTSKRTGAYGRTYFCALEEPGGLCFLPWNSFPVVQVQFQRSDPYSCAETGCGCVCGVWYLGARGYYEQAAMAMCVPHEMLLIKLNDMNVRGCSLNIPYIPGSDMLL